MRDTEAECPECGEPEAITLHGNLDGFTVTEITCGCVLTADQIQRLEWDVLEFQRESKAEVDAESGYDWSEE